MTFPYRDFNTFEIAHVEGLDPDNNAFALITDWTINTYDSLRVGDSYTPYQRWTGLIRPTGLDFESKTSLDQIIDIYVEAVVTENINTRPQLTMYIQPRFFYQAVGEWIAGAVTGKHYDGINPWDLFPRSTLSGFAEQTQITLATTPQVLANWFYSYVNGIGVRTNTDQAFFWRNGIGFLGTTYNPLLAVGGPGDECNVNMIPRLVRVRYFNALVNSLSRHVVPTAAGESVVITGLCFDPPEAELEEHIDAGPGPVAWNAEVDAIHLEGRAGRPDHILNAGAGAGTFDLDSDSQITMRPPNMIEGVYDIKLRKANLAGTVPTVDAYAGDFFSDADGRVRPGIRMTLTVSDEIGVTDGPDDPGPIILTDWQFKNRAGDIALLNLSMIDAPSHDIFYDGRITNISSLKREVDDNTGLFNISDIDISIANHDKEISKLLVTYFLKNQIVDIYTHFPNRPFSQRRHIHKCIVEDYDLGGPIFTAKLKDITRKYFGVKVPRYRCTEDEFPNIADQAKGQVMPEVLGLCSVTSGTAPGAVEAVYVDTVNFEYLAARGSLYAVDEVYSDGTEMTLGVDYAIVFKDGGRTYIDCVNDQGDNKITFNCKGYMYADWDSANGYVQSPVYQTAFLLGFIAEIPIELLNIESFDTLQATFITEGWDESGHLILQSETALDDALKNMLFTCGNYGFMAKDGRFKVERKTGDDFLSTSLYLYEQIHLLSPAQRKYNLTKAVNYIQSIYNFYPAPGQSFGSMEDKWQSSIRDFGAEIEAGSPVSFPWTNSQTLIQDRLTTMLLKRGYGDARISFPLSMRLFEDLDLLTDFRYQDPYGLSATGAGEAGRYYFIISLNYNWVSGTIDVKGVDLQWLLRLLFILGDYDDLAATWPLEIEANRIYGFLCGYVPPKEFSDGEPGKEL